MPEGTTLSGRDPRQPAWWNAPDKAWQLGRMRAYAAQIDRMDRGIGRIVAALEETGALEHTLFRFLSDNGASAEKLPMGDPDSLRRRQSIVPRRGPGRPSASATRPTSSRDPRTPTRATARRGRTCRTLRSASTSAGCTRAASRPPDHALACRRTHSRQLRHGGATSPHSSASTPRPERSRTVPSPRSSVRAASADRSLPGAAGTGDAPPLIITASRHDTRKACTSSSTRWRGCAAPESTSAAP